MKFNDDDNGDDKSKSCKTIFESLQALGQLETHYIQIH